MKQLTHGDVLRALMDTVGRQDDHTTYISVAYYDETPHIPGVSIQRADATLEVTVDGTLDLELLTRLLNTALAQK